MGGTICIFINGCIQSTTMLEEDPLGPFSYNYLKSVQFFEGQALEGQELHFHHYRLTATSSESNEREVGSLSQLQPGINTLVYLRFTILRVVRLQRCTYMLATTSRPFKKHTLAVLTAVNSEKKEVSIVQECLMPRVQIRVANPFRREGEGEVPHLIFLADYITIINSEGSEREQPSSEQLREQANNFFKGRKYVQAILKYQQALAHILGPSPQKRSILYSNSAACLFELRLFHSCAIYADLAVQLDPSYNKGYYRKINSYLELKRYSEVVPLLSKIHGLISRGDFENLNLKYTQYVANESGIFNWYAMVRGEQVPQGEYVSEKVEKVRTEDELRYYSREAINQYEVVVVNKPLIYIKETGSRFKDSFIGFLKQVQNYYLYDELFQQQVHLLPCKCHPSFKQRQQYYQHYRQLSRPLPKKQLFNKMQRCIFEQKSLDKSQAENGYGIWKEMFYFENRCVPNCTGVHINGCFVVCALTNIEKGTPLSIDLIADVQSGKRKETLSIKFDQECGCEICEFEESANIEFSKVEELYDRFEKYSVSKIKKQHIWAIINYEWQDRQVLQQQFVQLIYYYIYVIEKECEWDDVLNLLRLKEENDNVEINGHIDEAIKRLLMRYLRVQPRDIELFYAAVIERYIQPH